MKPNDTAAEELSKGKGYLTRLFKHLAPRCEPLNDLLGLVSQIDNFIFGQNERLREQEKTIRDWNFKCVEQAKEIEQLRRYGCVCEYEDGVLMVVCGYHESQANKIILLEKEIELLNLKELNSGLNNLTDKKLFDELNQKVLKQQKEIEDLKLALDDWSENTYRILNDELEIKAGKLEAELVEVKLENIRISKEWKEGHEFNSKRISDIFKLNKEIAMAKQLLARYRGPLGADVDLAQEIKDEKARLRDRL